MCPISNKLAMSCYPINSTASAAAGVLSLAPFTSMLGIAPLMVGGIKAAVGWVQLVLFFVSIILIGITLSHVHINRDKTTETVFVKTDDSYSSWAMAVAVVWLVQFIAFLVALVYVWLRIAKCGLYK